MVIPAIARFFTDQLNAGTPNEAQLQSLNPSKDAQGKWLLTPGELTANAAFAVLLAPDVQVFDLSGNYAPRTAGIANDAMSFGLGFQLANGPW